jgi:hypothetical protein
MADLELDSARDPLALLIATNAALESTRTYLSQPDWIERLRANPRHRIAMQRNIEFARQILGRLRLVLTVLPPFDSDEDWEQVTQAASKYDGVLGGVEL